MMDYIPKELKEVTLEFSIRFEDIVMTPKSVKQMNHLAFLYGLYKVSCIYEMKTKKHLFRSFYREIVDHILLHLPTIQSFLNSKSKSPEVTQLGSRLALCVCIAYVF
jgi:hypothetical protein